MIRNIKISWRYTLALAVLATVMVLIYFGVDKHNSRLHKNTQQGSSAFVGSQACEACHQKETEHWRASDHHHAMEPANAQTVLGDFNNTSFRYFGRLTRFNKKDDQFFVSTENQQGKPETFVVAYTLGYKPLQQYLVKFDDGRIQTLPFAWDTRKKNEGGQRWFHLYPDDNIKPDDPLFWTRPLQNWNYMCADCHTTDFSKNFSDTSNRFASHWSEMGNGCESCHGAGSAHVALMKNNKNTLKTSDDNFLINRLKTQTEQMDQCGVCHSRRETFKDKDQSPEKIMQTWAPDFLHEPLYFSDGQIHDEVFEVGSFMQSKMFAAGVTCSNCHDPHTTKLKAEGNALCTQCHMKETYDTEKHYFHPKQSEGAQCVSCHMPIRTYMVVNPRHDHHFSVPRPDLSETIDVPNTCVDCHKNKLKQKNKNNVWAAKKISQHFGNIRPEHFGEAMWGVRHEQPDAEQKLLKIIHEQQYNPLVRATALYELGTNLNPTTLPLIQAQLQSDDPMIRLGAVRSLSGVSPDQRAPLLLSLLKDSSRVVRMAVASLIVGIDKNALSADQQTQLKTLYSEYKAWLEADSDRGSALVALAGFYLVQGDMKTAQIFYEKALQRDEKSLSVYLNYADYYRGLGQEAEAEKLLGKALLIYPDSPDANYALGLLLVRTKQEAEALISLKRAMLLAPQNSQYAYVYGIGLYSSGQQEKGLSVLAEAQAKFPANEQILSALVSYYAERQDMDSAKAYAAKLQQLRPDSGWQK